MYKSILAVILALGVTASPIEAKVTAYAPASNESGICADSNPNVTATGTRPMLGTIAVDPKRIPYGTMVYIEGYGIGIARDTGAALRRYDGVQIDVVMGSHDEAINWGVKHMTVYVLKGAIE